MKTATGHHWITHGVINLLLCLMFGWLMARVNDGQGVDIGARQLVVSIAASLVVSWLIIAGFYVMH